MSEARKEEGLNVEAAGLEVEVARLDIAAGL